MSESHDQSYYEIALTNRQVVSIFVVLLFCVLVAFLGGVWLGRGADTAVEVASAQSITAGLGAGETPLEELDFFARDEQARRLSEAAVAEEETPSPEPAAPTSGAKVAVRESASPKGQRKASDPPEAGAAPPAVAKVETAPPVTASVEPAEPAPAPPLAQAEAKTAVAQVPDFVVIQVFSSNEEAQASRVVNRLRKGGYPAILSPVDVEGRTLYRVRIGPYTDRDEAQVVADSVRRSYKLDTWITH